MAFEKITEVISDAGGIRIMCEDLSFQIKNGLGDGLTKVYLDLNRDCQNNDKLIFFDCFTIKGKAYITASDCSDNDPIYMLPKGKYGAYYNKGSVYLSLWEKYE